MCLLTFYLHVLLKFVDTLQVLLTSDKIINMLQQDLHESLRES
jgi:hypothetical protein